MSPAHPSEQIFSFVARAPTLYRDSRPEDTGRATQVEEQAIMSSTLKQSSLRRSAIGGRARSKALGAAILATALLTAGAHANAAHRKFVLSGYEEQAAGADLLAGRYVKVIEELGPRGARFADEEIAASTNLCVAYIMSANWDAARPTCDGAVALAELDVSARDLPSREAHAEQVALAYSNRAVLNWLEDRPASAVDDLSKAHVLAPASLFVSENLAAFASRSLPVLADTRTTHSAD